MHCSERRSRTTAERQAGACTKFHVRELPYRLPALGVKGLGPTWGACNRALRFVPGTVSHRCLASGALRLHSLQNFTSTICPQCSRCKHDLQSATVRHAATLSATTSAPGLETVPDEATPSRDIWSCRTEADALKSRLQSLASALDEHPSPALVVLLLGELNGQTEASNLNLVKPMRSARPAPMHGGMTSASQVDISEILSSSDIVRFQTASRKKLCC